MPASTLLIASLLCLTSKPDTVPSDTIIARYYAAIGGVDRLHGDTSLSLSRRYEEGSFHAVTTMLWRRPNLRRVSVVGPDNFPYVEVFDGTTEWEFSESFRRAAQRDTGAAARAGQRGAEFDESFVDYAAKGHRVESRGLTSLADKDLYRLRVTLADGWVKEYYFDPKTGLLSALRKAMPLHAAGPEVESVTFYSDYRSVGGVLRPFRLVERSTRTGRQMNVLRSRITANVPIRDEAFRPPR